MRILGIETSCDETAAAVVENGRVSSNIVQGQVEIHAEYGGVVPELASRAHIRNVAPVVQEALRKAALEAQQLDGIAVTAGPGLIGGLLVGLSLAKGLARALEKPLIGVHHMEGHLMSSFLEETQGTHNPCAFPFVALLVSGGHTVLLHAQSFGLYRLLGQTRDDAAGEAFDKGAKMLGLPYPGGPAIATLAENGDPQAIRFPRALMDRDRFDFSFSGVKTALRTHLQRHPLDPHDTQGRRDVAASYQEALVDALIIKSLAACRRLNVSRLMIAGGVGANQRLRTLLNQRAVGVQIFAPSPLLCTDNGAMIAMAGFKRFIQGERSDGTLNASARWPITELCTS